jgi:hypothetical protein
MMCSEFLTVWLRSTNLWISSARRIRRSRAGIRAEPLWKTGVWARIFADTRNHLDSLGLNLCVSCDPRKTLGALVQMPDNFRAFLRQRDQRRGMAIHVPTSQDRRHQLRGAIGINTRSRHRPEWAFWRGNYNLAAH